MIPFGEWLPDQADLNNPGVTVAKNVIPHAMGYRPFKAEEAFSDALTAACRGAITATDKGGATYVYAGDTTKIQSLTDASWTDVTRSADPYATAAGERWEFVKWDEKIIATNFTDEPQIITLGGANFADLSGSPPFAKHIAVVRDFVVLGNVNSGGVNIPNRVWWSGIGDETTWAVSAVTQADWTDLKGNGGAVQAVVGGEYGVVFQENAIWRMSYVNVPIVWQMDRVALDDGLIAPGGFAAHEGNVFFMGNKGFHVLVDGTTPQSIGANKIDRYVFGELDYDHLDKVSCALCDCDQLVYWSYPGTANSGGRANRLVVYDYRLNKWSYSEQETEVLFEAATSGYTLDGLDSVTTDLDALTPSLDDPAWQGGARQLAKFDQNHKLAFFTGDPMTATIETAELQLTPDRRTMITGVRPLVDGGTTTVQVGYRKRQQDTEQYTAVGSVGGDGRVALRKNSRYHRIRANITGSWTQAQGVDIQGAPTGTR